MKTILSFLAGILVTVCVTAQAVTIEVKGTRNKQIIVDGQYYTLVNYNNTTGYTPIVLTGLSAGQHTLGIVRSNTSSIATKNFYLRPGYDLTLVVNSNGAVTTREGVVKTTVPGAGHMVPLADADFNILFNDVLDESRASMRNALVKEAFEDEAYFFTTRQARQLLQLVNSQAHRLTLAKLVYPKITDPANFTQMNDLFNVRNRRELEAYVRNYDLTNPGSGGSTGVAMSDRYFNVLFQHAQNQYNSSARQSYLLGVFNNTANYFTATQARKLILLMNGESDRLQLAKASYRGIVDKANFSVVTNLFSSQSARNDLVAYVRNYDQTIPGSGGSTGIAMSDSYFNVLFEHAQNQWNYNARQSYLLGAFNNTGNFFTAVQASKLIQLVNGESDRLQLAKASYRGIVDKANFGIVTNLLSNQSSRNELVAYIRNYNDGGTTVVTRVAMSDADFNTLYRDVANRWGLGAKMNRLTEIFNNLNYNFTTAQAEQLIRLVSSETNRLTLAKASYDNITDPANFHQLYDVLVNQSSKDELELFVRNNTNTNAGYGVRTVPMNDAEFNRIYEDVAASYGFGVKMNKLTEIFNNASYAFSTAQARQLIMLVSAESNRLQLAKASYDNITDPENFSMMYDIFEEQVSKDELAAYVRSRS